jgi:hypothetical protein
MTFGVKKNGILPVYSQAADDASEIEPKKNACTVHRVKSVPSAYSKL